MIRRVVVGVLALFAITTALAANGGFEAPARKYLNALKADGARVFVSACKTNEGLAIVVLPLGEKQGMFLEVEHDSVVNLAPVRMKGKAVLLDITNAQGGLYTFVVMQHHAEDAINAPFHLLGIGSLNSLVHISPGADCPDRPPKQ